MQQQQLNALAQACVDALRALMDREGWTQTDLHDKSGIPYITLSRWFNGHQLPTKVMTITAIRAFLKKHGVKVEDPKPAKVRA